MARKGIRYSDIANRIDIDALEAALGWTPESSDGVEDRGFCPFPENHMHGDTTGKFSLNREKRVFNCWVCGGGSLLSLVMLAKGCDEEEALEFLVPLATGDQRSDGDFIDEFLGLFEDEMKRTLTLPYFNTTVLNRWERPSDEWLRSRGISREVANLAQLCWAKDYRKPPPKGGKFAEEEDYHGSGVIFPHFWDKRLVGWQIRWDSTDRPSWVPKYVNTHDFPRERTVYGFEQITGSTAIVVESVASALFLRSCGYPAVATFGDSVNPSQLRLLRRFQGGVYLWPDNDKAGVKFKKLVGQELLRYVPVYSIPFVPIEKGDPGDLAPDTKAVDSYLSRAELLDLPST